MAKVFDKEFVWDLDNPLIYRLNNPNVAVYNALDPFAPVLFINEQPIVLNSQHCASGLHRYSFLLIAFLLETKGAKIEIKMNLNPLNNRLPELDLILKEKSQHILVQKLRVAARSNL